MSARVLFLTAAAAVLIGPACERIVGDKKEVPAIERDAVDRVVNRVCERLAELHAEEGPLVFHRLPEIKDEAAKAEDLPDGWAEFRNRLESTDPSLQVEVSRRITEHMRLLGEEPEDQD